MKNTIFTFYLLLLWSNIGYAQSEKKPYRKDGKFGFFVGMNNNEFIRDEKLSWNSIIRTYSPGFNGGLHFRPYNWRMLSSLIQVSYSQKGATEIFNLNKLEEQVAVRTQLNYLQLEIVPIEITPFYRKKMTPFINVGLFYSKLIKSNIKYQYNDSFTNYDTNNTLNLDFAPDTEDDKGVSIVAGLKFQNFKIEFRNEFGTKFLYNNTNIKNHSNTIKLRFSI